MVAPESASVAKAVMPTAVPIVAFSATELAAVLLSLRTTGLSPTLVTAIVKDYSFWEPSELTAWTVIVWLMADS